MSERNEWCREAKAAAKAGFEEILSGGVNRWRGFEAQGNEVKW